MIKTNIKTLFGMMVVTLSMIGMSFCTPLVASAADCSTDPKTGITGGAGCSQPGNTNGDLIAMFKIIANVALFLIGAVSVLMLIYGGIRYTISGGESGAITSAKNTILYAIVGIVVALLAAAIVNFVITSFSAQ